MPDLIIKKKFAKKDYECVVRMLNKVKKTYLRSKAEVLGTSAANA